MSANNGGIFSVKKRSRDRLTKCSPQIGFQTSTSLAEAEKVERDIVTTGVYSPETPQRPPPYCSQPSTIESCATPSTSLESGAQNTTTVHEANDAALPIPEKSSARLSIHRKSWGPATTLTNYMDYARQDPEKGAAARCGQEPRSVSRLEGKEWLPMFPTTLVL